MNAIMEFIFEAMKRDSSLAATLVRSTKLLPSIFEILRNFRNFQNTSNHLLTILSDKVIKLLHISLFHPQDYSVDQISKFLSAAPQLAGQNKPGYRNWHLLSHLFSLSQNTEVKLSLCRFIAELFNKMQAKQFEHIKATLDETMEPTEIPGVYDMDF